MLSGFLNWGWGLCRPHFAENHIQSKVPVSELFMDLRLQNRVFRVFRKNSLCASLPDDLWMKDNMVLNVSLELGHLLKIWFLIYGPKGSKMTARSGFQTIHVYLYVCCAFFNAYLLLLESYFLFLCFKVLFISFGSINLIQCRGNLPLDYSPNVFDSLEVRFRKNSLWTSSPDDLWMKDNMVLNVSWTSTENLVLDLQPKRVQNDCKVRLSDYSCLSDD